MKSSDEIPTMKAWRFLIKIRYLKFLIFDACAGDASYAINAFVKTTEPS